MRVCAIASATARSGASFNFELSDLYEGLAKETPVLHGRGVFAETVLAELRFSSWRGSRA